MRAMRAMRAMHAGPFALLVACAAPAGAPPVTAAHAGGPACDVTAAAESTRRARLSGATAPVIVVDVSRTSVQIAMVGPEVIVMRWVPFGALEPVVRDEVAVSARPNGAADPALHVLPGFRLPTTTSPWIPVHAEGAIAFSGFVPAGAKGRIWERGPDGPAATAIRATFDVHAAASTTSPIRARLGPGARVRTSGSTSQPWISVVATGDEARVEGFVERPRPNPRDDEDEPEMIEISDLQIEGEGTPWIAVGTCLWDAPDGVIVGAVSGPLLARPRPVDGWSAITVTTPWGENTYFANAPVIEPGARGAAEWKFGTEWRGE